MDKQPGHVEGSGSVMMPMLDGPRNGVCAPPPSPLQQPTRLAPIPYTTPIYTTNVSDNGLFDGFNPFPAASRLGEIKSSLFPESGTSWNSHPQFHTMAEPPTSQPQAAMPGIHVPQVPLAQASRPPLPPIQIAQTQMSISHVPVPQMPLSISLQRPANHLPTPFQAHEQQIHPAHKQNFMENHDAPPIASSQAARQISQRDLAHARIAALDQLARQRGYGLWPSAVFPDGRSAGFAGEGRPIALDGAAATAWKDSVALKGIGWRERRFDDLVREEDDGTDEVEPETRSAGAHWDPENEVMPEPFRDILWSIPRKHAPFENPGQVINQAQPGDKGVWEPRGSVQANDARCDMRLFSQSKVPYDGIELPRTSLVSLTPHAPMVGRRGAVDETAAAAVVLNANQQRKDAFCQPRIVIQQGKDLPFRQHK